MLKVLIPVTQPFIEASDRLRNLCSFRYLIAVFSSCRRSSICNLRTVFTHLLLTMASVQPMFIADK